jgi:sialic acid synthase SpsE
MIICEVGLNHLGSQKIANNYIDAVVNTRVDALTFQVIKDSFFKNDKYKNFKLEIEYFINAMIRVKKKGKQFGVAIDDKTFISSLNENGVDFFKVLSKDLNNYKLLDSLIDYSDKPIFVSTGMSDMKGIEDMIDRYYSLKSRIILVHTQLSHIVKDINFEAINVLREKFNMKVAFGFHCSNHNAIYMSLAYNPESIFFYIKNNDENEYPDDKHAIRMDSVSTLVDNLLELPLAIGLGKKIKMEDWA